MITLEISIQGDLEVFTFESWDDVNSYISELNMFSGAIWVIGSNNTFSEVLVSQSIPIICGAIRGGMWKEFQSLYIHEAMTFEEAYEYCILMKSEHPKGLMFDDTDDLDDFFNNQDGDEWWRK